MSKKSREHHWWPVGLQHYWTAKDETVGILRPNGTIERKKAKNRKIGKTAHGHTLLRNSGPWETNFEDRFQEVDDSVRRVIELASIEDTIGPLWPHFGKLVKLFGKRERELCDLCNFGSLKGEELKSFIYFALSLLVRSPGNRHRLGLFSIIDSPEARKEIGKANIHQQVGVVERILSNSLDPHCYIVFMNSLRDEFIFGDGLLDGLTGSLTRLALRGHALVPLTPNLCAYISTPTTIRNGVNYASFVAAPWMVSAANEITQVYSKDEVFFRNRTPKIIESFEVNAHRQYKYNEHQLLDYLNAVSGYGTHYVNLNGERVARRGTLSF
ncbi:MAG: hypothetical protein KIH44_005455 [Octadecabacter sp.]|nr:hypothetical protein [Octadecabacter sp.]